MKMTIYAYFRKLIKSTSVMLRLKLPRVLKLTLYFICCTHIEVKSLVRYFCGRLHKISH